MNLLTRAVGWLTLLLAAAGIASCGWTVRSGGLDAVLGSAWAWFGVVSVDHLVWLGLAGWLLLSMAARRFERVRPVVLPSTEPVHSVGEIPVSEPLQPSGPEVFAERPEPVRREQAAAARRLQLEALLRGKQPEVGAFVDAALRAALEVNASDLHFRPEGSQVTVSIRRMGRMEEIATVPPGPYRDVVRRFGVLARLGPGRDDEPRDGRLTLDGPRGRSEARLSIVPSRHGPRVVLRLAGSATRKQLSELGLPPEARGRLELALDEPQGLVVLTGPTGSGKTTTLYAALAHLDARREGAVLASIEDPVEVDLPFVAQTQVDPSRDLGFAQALRAVLRQDPDVLMVGEVRDPETAKAAVQAGLTGHLVLTTLHADSAAGVFARLIDLGAEPFLAASVLQAIVHQRLARALCVACRQRTEPTSRQLEAAAARGLAIDGPVFDSPGCAVCGEESGGVDGQIALFEVLRVDGDLRRLVTKRASTPEIEAILRDREHRTLADTASAALHAGRISLTEALRVIP